MAIYLSKKQRSQLLMSLAIMVALPVTVFMVQKIQSLQSNAAPGNATLVFNPTSQSNKVGDTGNFNLFLNPNNEKVNGIQISITYDPAIVDVTDIIPGPYFTDPASTIGQPLEINKRIQSGSIQYSIAFPLGSKLGNEAYYSLTAKDAAMIKYTAKAEGTANFAFVTSGTLISDINAQNVLSSATGGTLNVTSGARLYFSSPRPANPQNVNSSFDIDMLMDTGGQNVDGVDARARLDKTMLNVVSMSKPTTTTSISYPQFVFDNVAGTVSVSASILAGTTPMTGTNIVIATLKLKPILASSGSLISYDFVIGNRNDSNIVLSGTLSAGDPTDILASVTNATIVSQNAVAATASPSPVPTQTSTLTPTLTPLPTRTPTAPIGIIATTNTLTPSPRFTSTPTIAPTATVTLTSTPTPILPRTILVRIAFQGITRIGADKTKQVILAYKLVNSQTLTTVNLSTNSNGEGSISFVPGDYIFQLKAPGYLASSFGSQLNPIRITSTLTSLDLTQNPLLGGDFNGDGEVNEIDFTSFFLPGFRTASPTVDLDGSGEVNNLDFGIMRTNWGLRSGSI